MGGSRGYIEPGLPCGDPPRTPPYVCGGGTFWLPTDSLSSFLPFSGGHRVYPGDPQCGGRARMYSMNLRFMRYMHLQLFIRQQRVALPVSTLFAPLRRSEDALAVRLRVEGTDLPEGGRGHQRDPPVQTAAGPCRSPRSCGRAGQCPEA